MKNLILVVGLLCSTAIFAQGQIPQSAKAAFAKKYAKATDAKWYAVDDHYQVDFTQNDQMLTSTFSAEGKWLLTVAEYTYADIPDKVVAVVNEKYDKPFYEHTTFEQHADGKKFFRMTLMVKDEEYRYITISPEGKILTEEQPEEDELDDEEDY